VHYNVSACNCHYLQTHITSDRNHNNGASFPNQNMTHQQTSKDPNPKHEMENKTQKYTKEKPTCVLEFQITKNDLKTHNL
jgi:hypothetical protein